MANVLTNGMLYGMMISVDKGDIKMKTEKINARISPEAKEKLEKICQQEHRSQGAQIEYWISQFKLIEQEDK